MARRLPESFAKPPLSFRAKRGISTPRTLRSFASGSGCHQTLCTSVAFDRMTPSPARAPCHPDAQLANVCGRCAAAATDQPRAEAVPLLGMFTESCAAGTAMPAHCAGVIAFARVRVGDDRLGGA